MLNDEQLDHLAAALRLSAEQRKHLSDVLRRREAAETPYQPKVSVRVHLEQTPFLHEDPASGPNVPDEMRAVLGRFSHAQRAKMQEIEPKVLAWVRKSRSHALLMTTDPVAAIRKAVPDIDPALLDAIARARAAAQRAQVDHVGVQLHHFEVTADAHPHHGEKQS